MKWRGIGATALLFILFAGLGAAQVTIHSPADGSNYTNPSQPQVDISTTLDHLVNYSVPTAGIYEDLSDEQNDSYTTFISVNDGNHRVVAFATDGSNVEKEENEFTVDTTGPAVTLDSPATGTIFTRHPMLKVSYNDAVSSVDADSVVVALDGTDITENGTVEDNTFNLSLDSIAEGNHTVSTQVADEHGNENQETWWFHLPEKPVVSNNGPTGLVDGDDVTVKLSMRDPAGVDMSGSDIDVRDDEGDRVKRIDFDDDDDVSNIADKQEQSEDGKTITVSHDLNNLEDGEYTATATVMDNEENTRTFEWTFTVDTTAPDVEIVSHVEDDVVTETQTFSVEATDDLSDVEEVEVSLGGETESTSTEDDDVFHVVLDTTEVGDGSNNLEVTATDAADNDRSKSIDLMVDNTAPTVDDVEVYPETVAAQAKITATVQDAATGVESVSYRVEDSELTGTLVPSDGAMDESTEAVYGTLDVAELDDGTHTMLLIVKDGAGHSTIGEAAFDVDKSLSSELALETTNTLLVNAGSSKTFTVRVSNDGDADDLVRLSSSMGIITNVQPDEKRILTGETKGFDVTIETSEDADLGPRDVPVTIHSLGEAAHGALSVSVQPTPARQQDIEQELKELQETYSELSSSKDDYEDDVTAEETEETFNTTEDLLSEIETLIENGKYYTASQKLDDAEERVSEAETALTGMVSRYQRQQLISAVLKGLVVLLFIGIAVGVYRLTPDEEGFDTGEGFIFHEDDRHPVQRKFDEVRQTVREQLAALGDATAADGERAEKEQKDTRPSGWSGFDGN